MNKDKITKLYNSITNISDDIIEEAQTEKSKKRAPAWLKWGALAACLCIAVLGTVYLSGTFRDFSDGSKAGGTGGSGITYMSYKGPVFPLTLSQEDPDITAARNIDFNFSPYRTVTHTYDYDGESDSYDTFQSAARVTDSYILKNDSGIDKTVTAIYPFAARFWDNIDVLPSITVDGVKVSPTLFPGPYSGGFEGALDSENIGSLNLAQPDNWECYKALIEGGYANRAFDEFPDLNQPVIVYEISGRTAAPKDFENGVPTLNMEFKMDYNRTTILTWNMNGGTNDADTGYCARQTHVPQSFNPDYGQSSYLIVLGNDIKSYTLQGYQDGSCKRKLDTVTATVSRCESTLGEIMKTLTAQYLTEHKKFGGIEEQASILDTISKDMFLGTISELMHDHGPLSESTANRYDFGMLEDMFSEAHTMQRIMYLTFDIVIPAGGSTELTASMIKEASIDFIGENKDRDGYDMVTRLGSSLSFTAQTASVSNTEDIEIINQNFGFDPNCGVTSVVLDITQEHYYIEVRKVKK